MHAASPRWHTLPQHVYARHEDGARFAYDPLTGETWTVSEPAADLLDALRHAWQPGAPIPGALARHLEPGEPRDELEEALTELAREGLVVRAAEVPAIPLGSLFWVQRMGWGDIRLRLARVGPLPAPAAALVRRLLRFAPFVVAGAFVLAVWLFSADVQTEAATTWSLYARRASPVERALLSALGILLLVSVHELGHALAMTAVTGEPVTVGLRLFHGLPQGYADVSGSILIPQRGRRVAILLGGVAVEAVLWLCLVPWALYTAAPPLVYTMLRFGGAFTVLAALLPLVQNDGYFLLQEMTGRRDVMEASENEAARLLVEGEEPVRWLAFFWLLRVHAVALLLAVGGVAVGRVLETPVPFGLAGSALAAAFLGRHYLRLLRAARALGADGGAVPADPRLTDETC